MTTLNTAIFNTLRNGGANRDGVTSYEDIETIISSAERAANDGRWWLVA